MNRVFIDTNIFVNIINKEDEFLNGSRELLERVHNSCLLGYTRVICISEILAGFYMTESAEIAEKVLQNILSILNLTIMDYDLITAIEAAKLRGAVSVKLPDAVILSQALQANATLISRDQSLKKQKLVSCMVPEKFLKY